MRAVDLRCVRWGGGVEGARLHDLSAHSLMLFIYILLIQVLAFGSIPRPADCLAAPPPMDGQCHQRVVIDSLFSLLKWERGLLESKAFPRLRRLPHLLALLRRVLCGSVWDIFSLDDEYGSYIACSTENNNSPGSIGAFEIAVATFTLTLNNPNPNLNLYHQQRISISVLQNFPCNVLTLLFLK